MEIEKEFGKNLKTLMKDVALIKSILLENKKNASLDCSSIALEREFKEWDSLSDEAFNYFEDSNE